MTTTTTTTELSVTARRCSRWRPAGRTLSTTTSRSTSDRETTRRPSGNCSAPSSTTSRNYASSSTYELHTPTHTHTFSFLRHISTGNGSSFISTKLFLVLEPDAVHLHERPPRTRRALALSVLLNLSSFVDVSGIFFFNFLSFVLTMWTIAFIALDAWFAIT